MPVYIRRVIDHAGPRNAEKGKRHGFFRRNEVMVEKMAQGKKLF